MSQPKSSPSLFANVCIFAAVLILMFGIAELVVRIMFKDVTVMFPRYHTDAQYGDYTLRTIRPNSSFVHTSVDGQWRFTTNHQGFRNYKNFEYAKPEGVIRVVAIGDSHTQGYEVSQDFTFSAIIEKYLNAKGVKAEVLNTGVSGFSNAEALLLLENELYKYNPDYVVLGFYANDFQDNIKTALFQLDQDGYLIKTDKKQHIPGVGIQNVIYSIPGIQWLSENSYFYSLLFNNIWSYAKGLLAQKRIEEVMDIAINTKDEFTDYEQILAARLIAEMYEETKRIGAKFVLIDIPALDNQGHEVSSMHADFRILIDDKYDFLQPNDYLMQYRDLGVIHQPNGHRHITRFTHTILGLGVGNYILNDIRSLDTN